MVEFLLLLVAGFVVLLAAGLLVIFAAQQILKLFQRLF